MLHVLYPILRVPSAATPVPPMPWPGESLPSLPLVATEKPSSMDQTVSVEHPRSTLTQHNNYRSYNLDLQERALTKKLYCYKSSVLIIQGLRTNIALLILSEILFYIYNYIKFNVLALIFVHLGWSF